MIGAEVTALYLHVRNMMQIGGAIPADVDALLMMLEGYRAGIGGEQRHSAAQVRRGLARLADLTEEMVEDIHVDHRESEDAPALEAAIAWIRAGCQVP